MSSDPVEDSSCPTGIPLEPRSDACFVTDTFCVISVIFAASLGDISIRSNVAFSIVIDLTTIRIPLMFSNSLYTVLPSIVNDFGDVKSDTKLDVLVGTS